MLYPFSPDAWAAPKYEVLHAFTGGMDGGGLWGSLALDANGNVYGTTEDTVFELTPKAGGKWNLTTLQRFHYPGNGGSFLTASVIFDASGNLYGTTESGGAYDGGVVFQLTPGPKGWKEAVLYAFPLPGGCCCPYAGLVRGKSGNLYGVTYSAFELSRRASGWKATVLHNFTGQHGDGSGPFAGLIMDASGNLYGTTEMGGGSSRCGGGCGTVYELTPTSGGKWKETILHRFQAREDGAFPGVGALALDQAGSVYGTTTSGTIFEITPSSDGRWKFTVLYIVAGGQDGTQPEAGVVIDKSGNLYGTTINGGPSGCGVIYKLAPQPKGKWKYTVLHAFTGYDGCEPDANLILDSKGSLYGTASTGGAGGYGVAFELTP